VTEAEWLAATDPKPMLEFFISALEQVVGPAWYYRLLRRPPPRPPASDRKLRLFACACCRRVWDRIFDPDARRAVEMTERFIEGEVWAETLAAVRSAAEGEYQRRYLSRHWDGEVAAIATALAPEWRLRQWPCVGSVLLYTVQAAGRRGELPAWGHEERRRNQEFRQREEAAALCAVVREIVANPFRPAPVVDPAWLAWQSGTVPQLARAAYEERRLPEGTLEPARLAVLADALEDAGCCDAELLGHLRGPGPHVRGCRAVDLLLGKE
jgi:hypothetical protein